MAFKRVVNFSDCPTIRLGGTGDNNKPNPTQIEGFYLGNKTTPDKGYGPGTLHFFQTQKGVVGVWGKTVMNNQLSDKALVGQMVRVTFTGMGPKVKGKNPAFLYMVEHDDENTTDVSGVQLNAPEEPSDSDDSESGGDSSFDSPEDTMEDDVPLDEVRPSRPAPRAPAPPSADAQARARALLSGRKPA